MSNVSLLSPRTLAILVIGAVSLAVVLVLSMDGTERETVSEPAVTGSSTSENSLGKESASDRRQVLKRGTIPQKRPSAEIPERQPEEELWSMVPDRHALKEIQQWDFAIQGGLESPGTDPAGARREVDDPEWSEDFEQELEEGLREMVLTDGVEMDRIECERGRCLVELGYEGMERAFERVDPLRRWLNERVRCRAYSDGPFEGDSPSILPTQPIWILCGEPESSPYRRE